MLVKGLGTAAQQDIALGASTASAITAALVAATAISGPIGAAVAGVVAAVAGLMSVLGVGEGCGPTCIQATQIVNNAEPILNTNLLTYEAGQIDQQTALSNFNQMWSSIQQACGQIPGAAGSNCTGDRQAGACHYKQTNTPQFPGQPKVGECWNWFNAYHDPLTYPSVVAPTNTTSNAGGESLFSGVSPLLIGGAAVVIGLMSAEG